MKVWFIRHGEKEKGDFYNDSLHHQDQPISAVGRQQAQKLVPYFDKLDIDEIRVSQYLRTYQTAASILNRKKLNPIIDARLNEMDNGVIESMTIEQIQKNYPEFLEAFQRHDMDVRFPGGETGAEVKERQDSLLHELIEKNKNTVLVCHEGYMRLLLCNLLGLPVYLRNRFRIDYCGMIELEYNDAERLWKIIRVNYQV